MIESIVFVLALFFSVHTIMKGIDAIKNSNKSSSNHYVIALIIASILWGIFYYLIH